MTDSDIVELLRAPYEDYLLGNAIDDVMSEAADTIEALRAENAKLIEAARDYDQVVVSCKTLGAITNEQRIHIKNLRCLICALLEDVDPFTNPITFVRNARIRELAYNEARMEVEEKRDV